MSARALYRARWPRDSTARPAVIGAAARSSARGRPTTSAVSARRRTTASLAGTLFEAASCAHDVVFRRYTC